MKAKMNTLIKKSALAMAFGLSGVAYAAPVVIDLFSDPASPSFQRVRDETTGDGAVFNEYGSAASIMGGWRDLIAEKVVGDPGDAAVMTVSGGTLKFSNDAGVKGNGTVQWDGNDASAALDPTGLGGIDLSGKSQFRAVVKEADQGFDYSITVYTSATSWSKLSAYTLFAVNLVDDLSDPNDVVGPYDATYAFDWFQLAQSGIGYDYFLGGLNFRIDHGVGMADFSNVGAIEFTMTNVLGLAGLDLTIEEVTAVPEPGSMALAGLGLVGLAALRRRKFA